MRRIDPPHTARRVNSAPFVLTALALLLIGRPAMARETIDRIAAVVEGEVILLSEIQARVAISRQLGTMAGSDLQAQADRALSELIDEALLEAEVRAARIEVMDAEVDTAIAELRKQNGLDEASFERAVAMQGFTLEAYRKEVAAQLRRARLINLEVRSKVQISDADIDGAVQQQQARGGDREVRARHILLRVKDGASEAEVEAVRAKIEVLKARIEAGEPFDDLARQESEDATAKNGGDLGWFGRGLMVPPFEEAAFAAQAGTMVGPIRTRFGFHLIKVLAEREKNGSGLARQRQAVRAQLYGQALEVQMQRYLETLRNKAVIEIKIPMPVKGS